MVKLTPRLERFFVEALGGKALDEIQHAEARRADFKCFRGLLAIELKSLKEDGSERLENLSDELSKRPDWPIFYGSVPIQSILKHVREPERVKRRFAERIGRAIKDHIRKANKQLAAHEAAFPRKNMVKVVVLANEDHEIYHPETVASFVHHLLMRREKGRLLYPHIDAIVFISERHATLFNQDIALPIVSIESPSIKDSVWKGDVIEALITRWSEWEGVPLYHSDFRKEKFSTIEHVPERMKRHENWGLDYRRRPYMSNFTDEQLRERFDEAFCISSLAFHIHAPFKPNHDAIDWSMVTISHLTLEMGWRGIPVTQFKYIPERLATAAKRLGLPKNAVAWFEADMGRANSR